MSEFDKGIAFLSVVPMRGEPSDASEQVNVLLFGESFSILEEQPKWVRIQLDHDGYEGWIDRLQYQPISPSYFELLATTPLRVSLDPVQLLQGTGPTDYPLTCKVRICLFLMPVQYVSSSNRILSKVSSLREKKIAMSW